MNNYKIDVSNIKLSLKPKNTIGFKNPFSLNTINNKEDISSDDFLEEEEQIRKIKTNLDTLNKIVKNNNIKSLNEYGIKKKSNKNIFLKKINDISLDIPDNIKIRKKKDTEHYNSFNLIKDNNNQNVKIFYKKNTINIEKKNKILIEYLKYPFDNKLGVFKKNGSIIFDKDYILFGKFNFYIKQDLVFMKSDFYISTKQIEIIKIDEKYYIKCLGINYNSRIKMNDNLFIRDKLIITNDNNEYISFKLNYDKFNNPNNINITKLQYYKEKSNYSRYNKNEIFILKIVYWDSKIKRIVKFEEINSKIKIKFRNFDFEILKENNYYYIIKNQKLYYLIKNYEEINDKINSKYLLLNEQINLKISFHNFLIKVI